MADDITSWVGATMAALACSRPIFHSEADFQHSFAWQIHLADPDARVRLEPRVLRDPPIALDLAITSRARRIAVELKYLVRAFSAEQDGEKFALRPQGAQDIRRYDFIKDVAR